MCAVMIRLRSWYSRWPGGRAGVMAGAACTRDLAGARAAAVSWPPGHRQWPGRPDSTLRSGARTVVGRGLFRGGRVTGGTAL